MANRDLHPPVTTATGIARVSLSGRLVEVDEQVAALLARPEQDLLRCQLQDLTHSDDVARETAQIERLRSKGHGSYSMLKRYVQPDGSVLWTEHNMILMTADQSRGSHFMACIRPARIEASTLDDLHDKAFRDALTGLPNRHALAEQLIAAERNAHRTGRGFIFVALDLDGFKLVNDRYGHAVGDIVLKSVAERLSGAVRAGELVARQGGDEFALLLTDSQNETAVRTRIAQVKQSLAQPHRFADTTIHVSASLGWVPFPSGATALDDLVAQADTAMYREKKAAAMHPYPLNA